jgi:hypothetical protein
MRGHISRKGAKHVLSDVEGIAKTGDGGDGTKVDLFTGGNQHNRDELNNLFPLLSPVRRVSLRSWRLGARKTEKMTRWLCATP